MTAPRHDRAGSILRRARRLIGIVLMVTAVGIVILPLLAPVLSVIVVISAPAGFPILGLLTTTETWPSPEVVAMRERAERLLPPPASASFVGATITTYYDWDQWRCLEYQTWATERETRAYYDRAAQIMRWGPNDGYGFAGPDLVLPARVINPHLTFRPGDVKTADGTTRPTNRISVCFEYEFTLWPKRWTPPEIIVSWPHPDVVAWRERVEQVFPPNPTWTFRTASLIKRPDDYH